MMFRVLYSLMLMVGCAAISLSALAHHSAESYDTDHPVRLTGTVQKFRWTNPHALLYLEVPDKEGTIQVWMLEGPALIMLARNGWKHTSLKPGEHVQVLIAPSKDGKRRGTFARVILANGAVLDTGRIK